jgi:autotransporter-associated beta strand protein
MQRYLILAHLLLLVGMGRQTALGADNLWTNAAGNEAWNTTSANWTAPAVWNNANVDSALFGPVGAGPLAVTTSVTARGLQFNATGYSLTGSPITLASGGGGSLAVGEIEVVGGAVATIDNVIGGSVGLTKTGSGRLALSSANTYTGGTTISSGVLQLQGGGSLVGNVLNNATFRFANTGTTSFAGNLTGVGQLGLLSTGVVVLTGAATHAGGTDIGSSSTLQIGDGGTLGSITGDIVNDGVVSFNRTGVLTYADDLSGAGSLQKQGSGSLRITGNLSHTGGTTVSGGTLQIGVAGTTGSISGDITNNGFVAFNRSDNLTYGGVISGTGILSHSGNSVLTLTGNHAYTGETRTDAGSILSLGNGGTTGGILATSADPATIVTNGVVRFNRSNSLTFFGSSAGTGSIEKQGAGTLNLIGDYAHTGGTTISAGIVTLGTGATTGTLAGNITNNALFIFQNSAATTYAGTLSGTGTVSQNGSTLVTITGALNHAGPTNVGGSGGLSIGAGGTAGSISSNINVSSFVRFNRSNALAYGGVISGAGDVQKNGAGTLTLSTAHTYNGATNVNGGTLTVTGSGSLANSETLTVSPSATLNVSGVTSGANFSAGRFALASGQTLSGKGTVVGDLGVRDDATLAAGGSPGTTSVNGDVDFDPGSTLSIQLAGATDTDIHRSRLSLTGSLTFSGAILNPFEIDVTSFGGFTGGPAATYTIANAGSIGSSGLNSPLNLTLGAGGSGSVTNANFIRLRASGFDAGDQFTLQRLGDDLKLSFAPATPFLPGDYNNSGTVDAADYTVWRDAFGSTTSLAADGDGDGVIDDGDYDIWSANYGATAVSVAIPEPTTPLLLAACGLAATLRRRREGQQPR